MPRVYKKKPGSRSYSNYTLEQMEAAIKAVKDEGYSVNNAAEMFGVKRETLRNKIKGKHNLKIGGQISLQPEAERALAAYLKTCAEWGFPLDTVMLRQVVKGFLDRENITVKKFDNNLPGLEWVRSFLKRNKLVNKPIRNISNARAEVTKEIIDNYFDNLETTLANVPADNILNYDETCMHDDPGKKRGIAGKGQKYIERKLNTTKSGITVMFAGTAGGTLLPPYTVYKSENMWDTWREGGPKGSRYNRSPSGWFEKTIFEDWFFQIALPFFKKKEGTKVLIGDNLSAHLSAGVLHACIANNIKYVFLPANASHICQPLDVGFYGPLKIAWRKILMDFKMKNPGKAGLPKECFPKLLNSLLEEMKGNAAKCLESGFRKSGMFPVNRNEVYKSLPGTVLKTSNENPVSVLDQSSLSLPAINILSSTSEQDAPCPSCSHASSPVPSNTGSSLSSIDASVLNILQKMRSNSEKKKRVQKKTKMSIKPGKSVAVLTDEESIDDELLTKKDLPTDNTLMYSDNGQPSSEVNSNVLKSKPKIKRQSKVKIGGQKKKVKRKLKKEFLSDESVSFESHSESDNEKEFCEQVLNEIETEKRDEEELLNIVEGNMKPGVWVLVEGKGKVMKKHWTGQVISIDEAGDPMIKFLKKQTKYEGNKPFFTWYDSEGSVVDQALVVKVLPEPNFTPRGWLLFPVSFGPEYNLQ